MLKKGNNMIVTVQHISPVSLMLRRAEMTFKKERDSSARVTYTQCQTTI